MGITKNYNIKSSPLMNNFAFMVLWVTKVVYEDGMLSIKVELNHNSKNLPISCILLVGLHSCTLLYQVYW